MRYEGRHPGEFVMTEANGQRSRESLLIAAEQTIEANSILCGIADPVQITTTASVGTENAGNATIAIAAPAVSTAVRRGRYLGVATDATTVSWEDADGHFIGTSVHGDAFDGPIKFTVASGDTPNEIGDEFYVDVVGDADAWPHIAYAPDVGLPIAGIAIYGATTGAGQTTTVAGIVRDAEANGHCIAWPDGITAGDKANATQELAALGIIVRN